METLSLKTAFQKMYYTGRYLVRCVPKCQICCVLGLFFVHFYFPHLRALPYFPHFLPLSPLPFHPVLPVLKEVNKKLSYRGQTALSIIKTHERDTVSEHTRLLYLSVRQSRLAGRIMFSTCPFVRPSVRLFVRLPVTNLWTLYFEHEWTDFNANWHKFPSGARTWTVDLGGQEVKDQGHKRPRLYLEAWRRHSQSFESNR